MNHAHRLPFGAEIIGPDRARFRWWAPDLDSALLEIEHAAAVPMTRAADGWFECEASVAAGARYRYRIDPQLAVPDPASRRQSSDVHGWSVLVNPHDFVWRNEDWKGRAWSESVIYELHVGCCGGFRGVEEKLSELAQLGITAIELMPIADFKGERNWGYDGVLPFAPATAYGTPDQLKQLIDTAHGLGLCIYLDVVYNHFGPDGNYLHAYASAFFDAQTTSPWGAAIDFSQAQVRDFFTQNALYWLLEYRFDGLRIDAAHAIGDPGWLDEMAATVRAAIAPDRHVHLMLENEHNRADHLRKQFDAQWNDDWHNALHVLLTEECEGYYANYAHEPARRLARSLAEGFIFQGEPSPTHEGKPRGTPCDDLPPVAFINFLQNHDQIGNRAYGERLTVLVDAADLRAAIALQLLTPAIPLLFMGEEFGCRTPFLFFTDFTDELADKVRAGRRQEFAKFAAFAAAQQRECIPDPNASATFTNSIPAVDDAADAQAWRDFYRYLLQLRRDYIVPRLASCHSVKAQALSERAVTALWQFGDGATLCIALNFGAEPAAIEALSAPLLFECPPGTDACVRRGELPPHCVVAVLQTATLPTVNAP